MEKIVSLFQRDYEGTRQIFDAYVDGTEWVVAGEGVPTRKWDGTSVKIENGLMWKRYDAKAGRTPPDGWVEASPPDPETGHHPGWVPVSETSKDDQWHREALANMGSLANGTYELIGPKINGNPEGQESHVLVRHGALTLPDAAMHPYPVPTDFTALKEWFEREFEHGRSIEGIVWHHPDGRMVKLKAKDYGLRRPVAAKEPATV